MIHRCAKQILDRIHWRYRISQRITALESELQDARAERDLLANEVKSIRRDAEISLTEKSAYLANLSHEIRTPINAIIGFSTLARRMDLPPKLGHYLKLIAKSGETLRDIVNDVLDLSKIDASMMSVEAVEFSVSDVLAHVINLTCIQAAERDLEFVVAGAEQVESLRLGDPLRLGQVLTNLVTNAIKFTPRGFVRIKLESVGLQPASGRVRFSVEDSGIGMTEAQQGVVFHAFSQADASFSREYGGTGLGLTICKKLVNLMGGEIKLTSQPGLGSCFSFEIDLPIALESGPVKRPFSFRKGARVLLVGTSVRTREALEEQLASMGLHVQSVSTGKEALETLAFSPTKIPFDLVLMNQRMPNIDGILATQDIRRSPWLKDLPVILLVAPLEDELMAIKAEEQGIRVLLSLPTLPGQLKEAIRHATQGTALSAQDSGAIRLGASESFGDMAGTKVLLVDDSAANRELGGELLASAGIQVTAVGSGPEAIAMLDQIQFDAVLMDIQMPGMSGWETTTRIRGKSFGGNLPIIALTAHAFAGFREECLAKGMDDYIPKPVELSELFRILNKWIRRRDPLVPPLQPHSEFTLERLSSLSDLIDLAGVSTRMGGDFRLFEGVLRFFHQDPSRPEDTIGTAIEHGDFERAKATIHPLGGLLGTMGMTQAAAQAENLEELLVAGERVEAESSFCVFQIEMAKVRKCLDAYFEQLTS
jgi:signal transduction histidine kinase/DNA-binding response OmpR family regulator